MPCTSPTARAAAAAAAATVARLLTGAGLVLLGANVLLAEPHEVPSSGGIDISGVPGAPDECQGIPLTLGFDGTIESGVQWRGSGVQEDAFGAFGQGFDLGPGLIRCGLFWLAEEGFYDDALSDVYVWSGGVGHEPGAVLFLLPDLVFPNVPVWPEAGENRVSIEIPVEGSFTLGSWGRWPGETPGRYFWCTDTNGPSGPAWTKVAIETGYPPGWQHPSVVWSDTKSLAIGVGFEGDPVPVDRSTWGRIKSLYVAP